MWYGTGAMSKQQSKTVAQVVGENVRRLRTERGLTQEQLSRRARSIGLDWSDAVILQLESGRRDALTVTEEFALSKLLLAPIWEFYAGDGWIQVNPRTRVDRVGMRSRYDGHPDERSRGHVEFDNDRQPAYGWWGVYPKDIYLVDAADWPTEAETHAASVLLVHPDAIRKAALRKWKRPLDVERDSRLPANLSPRQQQARRGHVTRALLKELSVALQERKSRPKRATGSRKGGKL